MYDGSLSGSSFSGGNAPTARSHALAVHDFRSSVCRCAHGDSALPPPPGNGAKIANTTNIIAITTTLANDIVKKCQCTARHVAA